MKGVVDRLALFFTAGWQWLTAAPRYRGALLCSLSAIGAMIAIGYTGRAKFRTPSGDPNGRCRRGADFCHVESPARRKKQVKRE
jgi:hypothetical protein